MVDGHIFFLLRMMVYRISDTMPNKDHHALLCNVSEECSTLAFSSVKAFKSHGKSHRPRRSETKPVAVAAKPQKTKPSASTAANAKVVKVSTDLQKDTEPQQPEVLSGRKSVSKDVVSKQPPSQKRSRERSASVSLKPKPKARRTQKRKDADEAVSVETDSRQTTSLPPAPAPRMFSIPCHCPECLPCTGECCDNPTVRSGACCDPETLGHCLQPFQVRKEMPTSIVIDN